MLIVPALLIGRVSKNGTPLLTVMTVPLGMESVPLPPMVPPLQVMAALVRLMFAVPLSVPPCMVRVGMKSVPSRLGVCVPQLMRIDGVTLPATVFVPLETSSVPEPLMLEAASKLRSEERRVGKEGRAGTLKEQ